MEKKAVAVVVQVLFQVLAVLILASSVFAVPVNGDFSNSLNSWTASGDVTVDNEEAVLGDNLQSCSNCARLFQTVPLATGDYTLELDFLNGLSDNVPDQTFPDVFFATLYFINDASSFDPDNSVFDSDVALFDADYTGVSNLAVGATLGASPKGANWVHFTFSFTNNFANVIPFFELFGFNSIDADSTARIDNVVINAAGQPIPEPGTLLLLGSGIVFTRLRGSKRQCKR